MIEVRSFNNPFAGELFAVAEDPISGFYATHIRMQIYLSDLGRKIEEANKLTLAQLKAEDAYVATSILTQPDVDAQLNHFSNILQKGLLVSLYSYFENQIIKVCELCEGSVVWSTSFKSNNTNVFGKSIVVQGIRKIMHRVLVKDLTVDTAPSYMQNLLMWIKVRNSIVHNSDEINDLNSEFLHQNGITKENNDLVFSESTAHKFNDLVFHILSLIIDDICAKHNLVNKYNVGQNSQ